MTVTVILITGVMCLLGLVVYFTMKGKLKTMFSKLRKETDKKNNEQAEALRYTHYMVCFIYTQHTKSKLHEVAGLCQSQVS